MGRPKKPTALHVLEGDKHKDRYDPNEPTPPALTRLGDPEMPLDVEGLRMWHRLGPRLMTLGILTEADTYAFTALCRAWQDYTFRPCPKTLGPLTVLLGKFGCTPSDRAKISAAKPGSSDEMERLLAGGR